MLIFYIVEALQSIRSAKTSFTLTTISLTISVILILLSFIAIQVSEEYSSVLKSNIRVNVFLKESITKNDLLNLTTEYQKKIYADSVEYISKEKAAEQFIQETGEDFKKILDYNPLPASFVIRISEVYADTDSLNLIIKDLSSSESVDEVVFKEGFIYRLLSYIDTIKIYLFLITILVLLIAVYLVYATIRLIINSRMIEFETMKLVGAKLSTIKIPVIINGLIAGIISGILCYFVFVFITGQLSVFETIFKLMNKNYFAHYIIVFLTGPILVIMVSLFSLRKISLKI